MRTKCKNVHYQINSSRLDGRGCKAAPPPLEMATSSQPSQVLGKRRHEDDVSEETIDKRKKLMEEIEPLIPEGLSKNQRKKTIRQMMKEKMKPEWKYVCIG